MSKYQRPSQRISKIAEEIEKKEKKLTMRHSENKLLYLNNELLIRSIIQYLDEEDEKR